ncbi:hypothetical protein BRC70_01980 [Halobacteriales archaeon QH_6_68_27]|nr:MAG: hypothetical protein BRC70_01980 [Halobacteriales archaeon QH_6_68_27]
MVEFPPPVAAGDGGTDRQFPPDRPPLFDAVDRLGHRAVSGRQRLLYQLPVGDRPELVGDGPGLEAVGQRRDRVEDVGVDDVTDRDAPVAKRLAVGVAGAGGVDGVAVGAVNGVVVEAGRDEEVRRDRRRPGGRPFVAGVEIHQRVRDRPEQPPLVEIPFEVRPERGREFPESRVREDLPRSSVRHGSATRS